MKYRESGIYAVPRTTRTQTQEGEAARGCQLVKRLVDITIEGYA